MIPTWFAGGKKERKKGAAGRRNSSERRRRGMNWGAGGTIGRNLALYRRGQFLESKSRSWGR